MLCPNLLALRAHLQVHPVNTGRRIELTGPSGVISDDMEALHAESDGNGRIFLLSGVEFSTFMYRGQTQDHGTCTPSLARLKTTEEQLLALCQRIAFEDAIRTHPLVQITARTQFLDGHLYVDHEGLAQHYGHATDMLDITSNFDVASFFATCSWTGKKFEPFYSTDPGVIYRVNPALLDVVCPQDSGDNILRIVGWQPLPRPEQQRAYAVQLRSDQDFCQLPSIEKFRFSHNAAISQSICEAFDRGDALFPADAAAELSLRAKALVNFTGDQIARAWQRLNAWTGTLTSSESAAQIESRCGIQKTPTPTLNWNGLIDEFTTDQLQARLVEVLNRVRYRRAMYL